MRQRQMEPSESVIDDGLFYSDHLNTESDKDSKAIQDFDVLHEEAEGLKGCLQDYAVVDELHSGMRTYLVCDCETDELVGYYSLKAGMVPDFMEREESGDGEGRPFGAIPGIELANFAVDGPYREKHPSTDGCGYVIFEKHILPRIEVRRIIGVRFLYIWALPEDKLKARYEEYGFCRLSEEDEEYIHAHFKPHNDGDCAFMYFMLPVS